MSLSELDDIICHESSMSPLHPRDRTAPRKMANSAPNRAASCHPEVSYITRLKNKFAAQGERSWTQPFFVTTQCEFVIQYTSHFGTKAPQEFGHGSGISSSKPIQ